MCLDKYTNHISWSPVRICVCNGDGKEVDCSYTQMWYYMIYSDSGLENGKTFYITTVKEN